MIAKVIVFIAALAAVHATGLVAPAAYGHGLAIKAPAPPLLHAPLLSAPVLAKPVVAAPAVAVQKSVVTTHHAAPVAYAAPLPYAVAKPASVAYTTITRTAPVAPVLSHTGFLGAAPLAYTGLLGHGYGLAGHGYGLAGHGLPYHGHGLTYGLAPVKYGYGLGPAKYGYGKVLL